MNTWNDITFDERNDLVFEGRNKSYGAYDLRSRYNRTVTFIIGGVLLFSVVLFLVKNFADSGDGDEVVDTTIINTQIDLTPPPPAEELPPPPPPPPPPPMAEMVKFVPPVIKDDAVEEEPQKLQEEVVETNVGEKDQEGDPELVAPPAEEGPGEGGQEIFMVVEEMPEPPGGINAFRKYLANNIQYPAMAREAGISGKAYLKFVVEVDGSISDVQVLRGVPGCGECDKEAVRVLKSFPEKWKPGKNNGRPARVYYNLPISFNIQ